MADTLPGSDEMAFAGDTYTQGHGTRRKFGNEWTTFEKGLSKREYAAIHLCVPLSGTAWLDMMIVEKLAREVKCGY